MANRPYEQTLHESLVSALREADAYFMNEGRPDRNLAPAGRASGESGVRIKILITGEYPRDGKPKAVAFPDPAIASIEDEGLRVLTLPRLVELKLASGLSAPHRLRDLADVQELIKARGLDATFADQLDASVRAAFLDLERAARAATD